MPYHRHRRPECNTGRPHPRPRVPRTRPRAPRARRRDGSRAPVRPRSGSPVEGTTVAALRGTTLRRGIPGPSSPCHRYRSPRRPERRDACDADRGAEPARCRGPAPPARLPAAGEHLRRRSAARRSSVAPSSRSDRPSGPAATSAPSTSWSSTPTTTRDRDHRRPPRGGRSARPATRAARVVEAIAPDDPDGRAPAGRHRGSSPPVRASNDPWPRRDAARRT